MEQGWIKIYRQVRYKGFYKRSAYIHLWLHLLLSANHKPEEFMWNGGLMLIREGQFITGREKLSAETGIPESTIERILKLLENEHQIGQKKYPKYRVITIVNWKNFQKADRTSDNRRTTDGHKQEGKELKEVIQSQAPVFVFSEYLKKMDDSKDEAIQLIAHFFRERQIRFDSLVEVQVALKRHLRPARQVVKFPKKKVFEAFDKCKYQHKDVDWSLETVLKKLTN